MTSDRRAGCHRQRWSHQTPSDQAMLPARPALTVGRHSSATARANWMVANAAFHATRLCSISRLAYKTGPLTGSGLPVAEADRILVGNARLNMKGWYCNAASSNHSRPRAIWSRRRKPVDVRSADHAAYPRSRSGLSAVADGKCG